MMDCKKALRETQGDVEAAIKFLRKKGLAGADKKAGRAATEGLVASYIHAGSGYSQTPPWFTTDACSNRDTAARHAACWMSSTAYHAFPQARRRSSADTLPQNQKSHLGTLSLQESNL